MRIVFLTSSNIRSGGAIQAYHLARGLMARGHALTFFVPHGADLPALDPSFPWRELPPGQHAWRRAVEEALPDGPFVFHAFHNKAVKKAAWWGLSWRRRGGVVVGHRGVVYKPNNPLPYWSPGIDCFIVNSRACADVLRRKGVSSRRLHVVYNGIPEDRVTPARPAADVRAELGAKPGELILGSVTDDSFNKGLDVLIPAFASAGPEAGRLALVGCRAKAWPKWTALAREHDVLDRVTLVDRVANVADYLQTFDAFVLSSRFESMPNVLLEAMRLGLPVIATAVGGVPELVRGNGLLVPPADPAGLACALRETACDPAQRAAWSARSLDLAQEFSMEHKVDRVEAIYRDTLAARGLPAD